MKKKRYLEVLRQSMSNRSSEDDFIVKMDKDDRKRGKIIENYKS